VSVRTKTLATFAAAFLVSGCAGVPATSQPATSAPTQTSLLPDGLWEAELSAAELIAAGAPATSADGGVYRWTFDGERARITVDNGRGECDADASQADQAVRLTWHMALGCGGFDTVQWAVDGDGLHLSLVESNGDPESTKAILEAKPWQQVSGDATLTWSDAWKTCENPEGGACLNTLRAGNYTTEAFDPGLVYTMPDGWQNLSDSQGEVSFVAPGDSPSDLDAEYIVVFASVRAENRKCTTESEATSDEPGVARTPEAIAAEFQARPGLATTTPQAVTIGGLSGLVMDIRMAPGWTGTCFYSTEPGVQLLGGVPPSDFDHGIIEGLTIRLYLLARGESTVAIEIGDYADGAHLEEYSAIVEQFVFGTKAA
jgi:hypothetical protein